MRAPGEFQLPSLLQAFAAVFADRLERREARLAIGGAALAEEALVHQRGDGFEDIGVEVFLRIADSFRGLESADTGEDGEPAEELLFGGRQQVVAPVDGAAERTLAFG